MMSMNEDVVLARIGTRFVLCELAADFEVDKSDDS